jgi:type II secretory pathway pseudopilin PulG
MTLVELLVVVVILLVLAATVLPLVAGSVESRRSREATRSIASFIAKAQSRSIGSQQWSGYMMVPTGTTSSAALRLYLADVPPPYMGDSATTTLSGTTPTTGTWTGTTAIAGELTSGTGSINAGDLIRLDCKPPFYEVAAINTGTLQFRMRTTGATENAGQSMHSTPWPTPSPAVHTFEILRRPVTTGSPFSIAENRAIDISWSGIVSGTSYVRFSTVGSTVAILYDGTGRLRQAVTTAPSGAVSRNIITGPLLLLVGRPERVGQIYFALASSTNDWVGANWQYPDSTWIAIDPMTGIVRTAACASGTTEILSQAWIRQALTTGNQ